MHKKHLLVEVLLSITLPCFYKVNSSLFRIIGLRHSRYNEKPFTPVWASWGISLLNSAADNDGNRANFGNLGNLVKTSCDHFSIHIKSAVRLCFCFP